MKTNKTLLALALGATVAPAAFGQINLYLTGSSAFANNIRQCITNSVLVPGATMMTVARTAANGSSIADGTTCWAISGTLSSAAFVDASIRGQTITIYDAYAGSSEGIRDLKNNYTIEYVNLSGSPKLTSRSGADAALTDVQLEADIPPAKTTDFEAGTRTNICVQTFVYLKNFGPLMGGLGSGVKNITRDQALALFTQSGIMNPLFIGGGDNAFDPAQALYMVGRYPQSGTRISFEKNVGFVGSEIMYDLTVPGGPAAWPAFSGYASGGLVKGVTSATSNNVYNLVGYLGASDAIPTYVNDSNYACLAGVTNLSYNGVAWSSNNVVNGSYPLWAKEMGVARKGIGAASPATLKAWQAVVSALCDPTYQATYFTGRALPLSLMNADRTGDGTAILPLY